MAGDRTSNFTRRKFTITEELDRALQQLASRHYQGNVSLCLRAAIKDHEATLTENDDLTLSRVEREVRSMKDTLKTLAEGVEESTPQRTDNDQSGVSDAMGVTHGGRDVLRTVREQKSPLRLDDLVDLIDLPPEQVIEACERLLDLGYIVETSQGRYGLASAGGLDEL